MCSFEWYGRSGAWFSQRSQFKPSGRVCSASDGNLGGRRVVDALHEQQLAEAAPADELAGDAVHRHRALLAADLEDTVVAARGFDQRAALGDVEGERLLRVDILAGLAGVDRAENALMVGGGDDDAIDILQVEQRAVVLVDAPVGLALGDGLVGSLWVAIGDGHDLRARRELVHQQVGAVAGADHPDADAVVRSEDAARKKERRGSQREQRASWNAGMAHGSPNDNPC